MFLTHPVVWDVVPEVSHGRPVDRRQPERVHPEVHEVVQPGGDAGQVSRPVTVRVLEGPGVDLVDSGAPPPVLAHTPDQGEREGGQGEQKLE